MSQPRQIISSSSETTSDKPGLQSPLNSKELRAASTLSVHQTSSPHQNDTNSLTISTQNTVSDSY